MAPRHRTRLRKPRIKKPKIKGPSEHTIQSRLIDHLRFALRPEIEIIAIPNGGKRPRRTAIMLKAEGLRPGATDLVLALPAGKAGWLEMKTDVGRLEDNQEDFRDRLLALGHLWAMARSVKEALIILTKWDALLPAFRVYENDNDPYRNMRRLHEQRTRRLVPR